MMRNCIVAGLTLLLTPVISGAQLSHRSAVIELTELLRIPNVASNRRDILANAALLQQMLSRRGLAPRLLYGADTAAPPAVYGEWKVPGATRTLVFYAHYDGQPTDPKKWTVTQPWEPVLLSARADLGGKRVSLPESGPIDPNWRIYARGSSDDKAGVMAIIAALDALKAAGKSPAMNVKLFFDGEEEAGSPHIADIVRRHAELLASDAWIICDGPVHQSGRKQVVFGARGDVNVDITVYGPLRPLHSGHYGNWAPNPAMTLARLLASMKEETGRVTIAGWYDDVVPLGAAELAAMRRAPPIDSMLQHELAVPRPESRGKRVSESINEPSLNINGIAAAEVGDAAQNVIPTTAMATLDLRLVLGNDMDRQIAKLVRHIRAQGFHVLDREPTPTERRRHARIARVQKNGGGYNAERTRMDLPISKALLTAVQSTSLQPIVATPTLGGSLPLNILRMVSGAPSVVVPIANYDNNQHAEDENMRLGNLFDGIETMAAVMLMRW